MLIPRSNTREDKRLLVRPNYWLREYTETTEFKIALRFCFSVTSVHSQ
jgi:hypothetical protein